MKTRSKHRLTGLLIVILLIYIAALNMPNLIKLFYPLKYDEIIIGNGKKYGIDPALIAALIKTESNFDTYAESKKGARGLMQITPSTGQWIAEQTNTKKYDANILYDPETNIQLGCWYIKHLNEYYRGDFELVFAAYNGGSGNVDKWLKDENLSSNGKNLDTIPFKETENFVKRVKLNYSIYKKIYNWNDTGK
ncbi:MAG: lytic transglycosylase domain-containing protein [Caulobacteraceae bacterium]